MADLTPGWAPQRSSWWIRGAPTPIPGMISWFSDSIGDLMLIILLIILYYFHLFWWFQWYQWYVWITFWCFGKISWRASETVCKRALQAPSGPPSRPPTPAHFWPTQSTDFSQVRPAFAMNNAVLCCSMLFYALPFQLQIEGFWGTFSFHLITVASIVRYWVHLRNLPCELWPKMKDPRLVDHRFQRCCFLNSNSQHLSACPLDPAQSLFGLDERTPVTDRVTAGWWNQRHSVWWVGHVSACIYYLCCICTYN